MSPKLLSCTEKTAVSLYAQTEDQGAVYTAVSKILGVLSLAAAKLSRKIIQRHLHHQPWST